MKQLGPVSYLVDVGDGRTWRRHIEEVAVEPPIMPAVHGQTTDLSSEDSSSPMDNLGAIVPEAHVETNRDSSDLPAQTDLHLCHVDQLINSYPSSSRLSEAFILGREECGKLTLVCCIINMTSFPVLYQLFFILYIP